MIALLPAAALAATCACAAGGALFAIFGWFRRTLALAALCVLLLPAPWLVAALDRIGAARLAPTLFIAGLPAGAGLTVLLLLHASRQAAPLTPIVRASGGGTAAVLWHAGLRPRVGALALGWLLAFAAALVVFAVLLQPRT